MAVANPLYNPKWKEIFNEHCAALERLSIEQKHLTQRDQALFDAGNQYESPEREALELEKARVDKEWLDHHDACLETAKMEHPTIGEYARSLFKVFKPGVFESNHLVHLIDYDRFQTLEEVAAAWSEANEISKQAAAEKRGSLPVGRPDGKNIFTKTEDNILASSWQDLHVRQLYPTGPIMGYEHMHTLVSLDQRKSEYHICFTQDPDIARGGMSVTNEIEKVATIFYNRAYKSALEKDPQRKLQDPNAKSGMLSELMAPVAKPYSTTEPVIHADQFHFYVHYLPSRYSREKFIRVDMNFTEGQFQNPEWREYDVVPEHIQKAYAETQYIRTGQSPETSQHMLEA